LGAVTALLLAIASSALADVHYVDGNSTNATPPYTNWTTAATNIQDAVDAAVAGDEVVGTNGAYATGGRAVNGTFNRVAVEKPLSLRSVNGPQFTTISGGGYWRCVYLTTGATLSGFTLTEGSAHYGGGASGGTLSNCTLTFNQAVDIGYGGGAAGCTLNNCTLTGNSAQTGNQYGQGGGAFGCTLNNCTLTGNNAGLGGGAYACALRNCIVYFNTADVGRPNYDPFSCGLSYCCTWPQPPRGGFGTITNAPLLSGLRLQPNSPCINAGNNSYVTNATDLDGNPRSSGGIVDIGAYEFQWPQLTIAPSGPNLLLRWPTNSAGYDYTGFTLQSTTNLVSPSVWSTDSPTPVVIVGQNTVTNPSTGAQKFYRLSQ